VDHILYQVNTHGAQYLWLSLPAHILLPQRATQFAYPVALLCLVALVRAYTAGDGSRSEARAPAATATMLPVCANVTVMRKPSRETVVTAADADDSAEGVSLDPSWLRLSQSDRVALFGKAGVVAGLLPLLQVLCRGATSTVPQ
jgi:hypothetical protein